MTAIRRRNREFKRAQKKHDPIFIQLLTDTIAYLNHNQDIQMCNEYIELSLIDWRRYCGIHSKDKNQFRPMPDAFINGLTSNYAIKTN